MKNLPLLRSIFLLLFACTLSLMASEPNVNETLSLDYDSKVSKTALLEEAKERLIPHQEKFQEWFSGIKKVELHFFWTSGMKGHDLKEKYGASKQVHIGGREYGEIFPIYLEALLQDAPENLSVYLTLDSLTLETNQDWVNKLQSSFGARFSILPVEESYQNIVNQLPQLENLLNIIFQNATSGNPAIASDFYRLLGMPLGRMIPSEQFANTQFTYCDIDTFTHSIRSSDPLDCSQLFTSLFERLNLDKQSSSSRETSFKIGRHQGRNDLIKVRINNVEFFKDFWRGYLTEKKDLLSICQYKTSLYNFIVACETGSEDPFRKYQEFIAKNDHTANSVIWGTGPGLLDTIESQIYPSPIQIIGPYPQVSTYAWHGTQNLEYCAQLDGIRCLKAAMCPDSEQENMWNMKIKEYIRHMSNAFYAKRLGKDHPFNIWLYTYLQEKNPFLDPLFKEILEIYYTKDLSRNYQDTYQEWLDKQLCYLNSNQKGSKITQHSSLYLRLQNVLGELGVEFKLTMEDLDFQNEINQGESDRLSS